jgi:hypothetical protein
VPFGAHCHRGGLRPDVAPLRVRVATPGHWGPLSPVPPGDWAVVLAGVSPPPASAGLLAGLGVLVQLAWPGALGLAVWAVAKPHSSAQGLAVSAPPVLLSPLAVSAPLALHRAALALVAQTPPGMPLAVSAALYCSALAMESLGA